eukprot:1612928-Alexandrium_andersonii.AAC.1
MVMTTTCRCRHHTMTRSPELLRGPFCVARRAEREYGNKIHMGAPEGSFCVVARAGRGGGIDNAGK